MLVLRFQQLERSVPRGLVRHGLMRYILPSDRCATRRPLSTITTINSNSIGDQSRLSGFLLKGSITNALDNRGHGVGLSSNLQGHLARCLPSSVAPIAQANVSTLGSSMSTDLIYEQVRDNNVQGHSPMELDSVLRKRRKKMKKHKLRKRRRRERAEKRKLSQGR